MRNLLAVVVLCIIALPALAGCGGGAAGTASDIEPTPLAATSRPVDGQLRGYFPPKALSEDPEQHQRRVDWYTKHLRVMEEPMLYASLPQNREVFRFLRLPSWGRPVAVRVQSTPAGEYRMIVTVLSGSGGYEPGVIKERHERSLSEQEWRGLKQVLRETEFWNQPAWKETQGRDGEQWIIEGISGDRYHVVDRWTPRAGPVHRIGSYLLDLAGRSHP